jgi:hypothetical protein
MHPFQSALIYVFVSQAYSHNSSWRTTWIVLRGSGSHHRSTSGIGLETARHFLREGARIAITGNDP